MLSPSLNCRRSILRRQSNAEGNPCPASAKLPSAITAQFQAVAPDVKREWLAAQREVFSSFSEGLIDMAHLCSKHGYNDLAGLPVHTVCIPVRR